LRADLVDRLSQHRIEVPPLRRRREDIPPMAAQFLRAVTGTNGSAKAFSRAAMAVMAVLPWAGNARELHGLVETLARSVSRPVIQLEDLLAHATFEGLAARVDAGLTLKDAKARFERDCISAVLVKHRGRVGEAAKALGIQRTNLYRKVRQLNVARSLLAARK
jgi:two-component system nitrogen regulation response regulator NtrX